jgi:CRISPR-associated protein (TIGR03986 family)
VVTPLLLLDTARAVESDHPEEKGHLIYPPAVRDGRPHLPATSVKGMLRAAYETVTNSRFGVFTGHGTRLGYRVPADTSARGLRAARVTNDGTALHLLDVAKLRAYPDEKAVCLPDGSPPEHGMAVRALIRRGRNNVWAVVALVPLRGGGGLPAPGVGEQVVSGVVMCTNRSIAGKSYERLFYLPDGAKPAVHPLRYDTPADQVDLEAEYNALVADYRAAHRDTDIRRRPCDRDDHEHDTAAPEEYLGDSPGRTAWSRHLYAEGAERLRPGTLCWARMSGDRVVGLYPVMLSRRLFDVAPVRLLDDGLQPAGCLDELSPADRVFGWVRDSRDQQDRYRSPTRAVDAAPAITAWRGNLRVGPVRCDQGGKAIHRFGGRGLPLAVLAEPKPSQGRFYVGEVGNAGAAGVRPLADRTPKSGWFAASGRALRGRKLYPHHAGLPSGYWENPDSDRTQQPDRTGRFQEYRRPHEIADENNVLAGNGTRFAVNPDREQRDDQNRSVTGWVKEGTTFRFTIDVHNLSDVELGALLWLLTLPARHFHRLGLGKPLGFGSVRLEVDETTTDMRRGESWRAYYLDLAGPTPADPASAGNPVVPTGATAGNAEWAAALQTVAKFEEAAAAGGGGSSMPVLRAFLDASRGWNDVAVHYPRVRPEGMRPRVPVPPDPRGRAYEWFTQNEKVEGGAVKHGRGHSLPDTSDPRLEVYRGDTEKK